MAARMAHCSAGWKDLLKAARKALDWVESLVSLLVVLLGEKWAATKVSRWAGSWGDLLAVLLACATVAPTVRMTAELWVHAKAAWTAEMRADLKASNLAVHLVCALVASKDVMKVGRMVHQLAVW